MNLEAPRRTGKTTLAENYLKKSKEEGLKVGYITFSSVKAREFEKKTGLVVFHHPSNLLGNIIDVLVIDEHEAFKRMYNDEEEYWLKNIFIRNVRRCILIIN